MGKNRKIRAAQPLPSPTPQQIVIQRIRSAPQIKHLAVAAALFVVVLAAYSNSFRGGFPMDNDPILLQDPRIQQATTENVVLIFSHSYWWTPPEKGLYRPLTTLTYLWNYAILGDGTQSEGYHEFNFLLHFFNVLLCYGIALSVMRKFWPAVFVAALWAVHPILTESVTNIIGRADLLAAFGVLSGFWMYWKSRESSGIRRAAWLIGVMAATTVGIFAKESAIAILGLIILCEIAFCKGRAQLRGLIYGLLAAGLPILAFLYQRSVVMAHSALASNPYVDNPLLGAGFFTARLTAIKVLARYLWLFVWPAKLSWNYYFSEIPLARGTFQDWMAWIVIVAAVVGVCLAFRRNRLVFFFAGFAFIALIPVSNLLILIGSIMADRFLYLPSVGIAACVVIGIYALGQRIGPRTLGPILLCVLIVALGARTWARNLDWQDNMTLLTAGVRDTPGSFASHFALATQLYLSDPSHSNLDSTIAEAEKSLAILDRLPVWENFGDAYANAGTYYQVKGDLLRRPDAEGRLTAPPESIAAYNRALEILGRGALIEALRSERMLAKEIARGKKKSEVPYLESKSLLPELALTQFRLGDLQNAYAVAQQALVIDPQQPQTFVLQAQILILENHKDQAATAVMEAYMASGNPNILRMLSQLYSSGLDPEKCAITLDASGASLNTSCKPVHDDICRAKAALTSIYTEAHRLDLIDDLNGRTGGGLSCAN
jgi:tetratricopeptide (TPR) repeat protein